jgi:hydroxyethylthiazole kinase
MVVIGIAGEIAAEGARGPGALQVRFLDALYCLTQQELQGRIRLGS